MPATNSFVTRVAKACQLLLNKLNIANLGHHSNSDAIKNDPQYPHFATQQTQTERNDVENHIYENG